MNEPRTTIVPGLCGGRPTIRGLRITVANVLEMLAGGMTHDEILAEYPYLERDDVADERQDFVDLAAVRGTPPIVLLVAVGNASTASTLATRDAAWAQIETELERTDAGVASVERDRLSVLRRA